MLINKADAVASWPTHERLRALKPISPAPAVFEAIRGRFNRLKLAWADGMYQRMSDWVARWRPARPIRREIVERVEPGFEVPKRRRVVERTLAWLGGWPAEQGLRGDDRR